MDYTAINKASKEFQKQFERLEECSNGHSRITFDAFENPDGCPLCLALEELNDKDSIEELQDQIRNLEEALEDYNNLEDSLEEKDSEINDLEERVKELEEDLEERNKAIEDQERLRDNLRML
jgi:DNA repair exonuclease SbcCD ATPase subunit